MGFSRKDDWSWLPFPPLGDLRYLGIEPTILMILHFLHCRQFLYHRATWEAQVSLCIVSFSVANGLGGSENATGELWTCIFQFWAGGKCFQFPITKIIGQDLINGFGFYGHPLDQSQRLSPRDTYMATLVIRGMGILLKAMAIGKLL